MQQPQQQPEVRLPRAPGGDVGDVWTPSRPQPLNGAKRWSGDWMKKWVLMFRACALLFSLLSFVLMIAVSDFQDYGARSYALIVAIVTIIHTAVQVGIKGHELRTSQVVISPEVAIWIDFCGDQILAYLLLSSAAAGAAMIAGARKLTGEEKPDAVNVSLAAGSVSMFVLAFIFIEPVALFSAYRFFVNI